MTSTQMPTNAIATEQKVMDIYEWANYAKMLSTALLRNQLQRAFQEHREDERDEIEIKFQEDDVRALLADNPSSRNLDSNHKAFGDRTKMGTYEWIDSEDMPNSVAKEIFPAGIPQFIQYLLLVSGDVNDLWYADPENDDEIYIIKSFRMRPANQFRIELIVDFEKQHFVECLVDGEQYLAKDCYTDGEYFIHEDAFANFCRVTH